MKSINQRQSPRIDIRLHCQVSSPGLCDRAGMMTENVSRSGLLVVWDDGRGGLEPPALGDLVTVEIELPAHHGFGRKCIHCQAVVVRVASANGEAPRVALSINYMKFREYRDNISALEKLEPAGMATWVS
jgi:hypothetical protein